MLELVEAALDQIAFFVGVLVVGNGLLPRAARRDHGFGASSSDDGSKPIGVEALVGQELVEIEAVDQRLGLFASPWESSNVDMT